MKELRKNALIFILLVGLVSLFSDMTHEGAKSIYGPFLQLTGASPSIISFIGGLGEFLGTALIFITSIIANKTKKYWTMTIIGYTINLFCIPLLSLTTENGFIYAISLILLERIGKAIRKPAKNTLVSFSSKNLGEGKSFAVMECLDQIGAFLGPIIVTFLLYLKQELPIFESYKFCFMILIIPAIITLLILLYTSYKYPTPEEFEEDNKNTNINKLVLNKSFVYYLIAISFVGFSLIGFPLISVHIVNLKLINDTCIPLLYGLAMFIDSISALIFGFLFDKIGFKTLIISTFISLPFNIFLFSTNYLSLIIIGIILWGINMGAIESILKSSVAKLSDKNNRSKCFGIFEGVFGISCFLGSIVLGIIYEFNLSLFIILPTLFEIISIIFYSLTIKNYTK